MQMVPVSKVMRVKGTHLTELVQALIDSSPEKFLKDNGFRMIESSNDGFFETWESDKYRNSNKSTLVSIDDQGDFMEVKFSIKAPE
jgi:hypothetical protein